MVAACAAGQVSVAAGFAAVAATAAAAAAARAAFSCLPSTVLGSSRYAAVSKNV